MGRYRQQQRETPQSRKMAELGMALQLMQAIQGNQNNNQPQMLMQAMLGMQQNETDSIQAESQREFQQKKLALERQQMEQANLIQRDRTAADNRATDINLLTEMVRTGKIDPAILQAMGPELQAVGTNMQTNNQSAANAFVKSQFDPVYDNPNNISIAKQQEAIARLYGTLEDPYQQEAARMYPWGEQNQRMVPSPGGPGGPSAHPDAPGYASGENLGSWWNTYGKELATSILDFAPRLARRGGNAVRGLFGMEPTQMATATDTGNAWLDLVDQQLTPPTRALSPEDILRARALNQFPTLGKIQPEDYLLTTPQPQP